jgi:hypothetical protein
VSASGLDERGRLPLSTLSLDVDNEGRESLFDVADDGTVRYGGVLGGHAWKPGGTPHEADTSDFSFRPAGFPQDSAEVRLDPSGTWGAWPTDEVRPGTGDIVTYHSFVAQRRGDPSTRFTFPFADRYAYVDLMYWESETDLIVIGSRTPAGADGVAGDADYLRCDVRARTCEVAPAPGE